MPRVNYVKKARQANSVAKVGEPYYWWKFRFGGKRFSKTPPKRSELTQSSFLSQLYDIQDRIADLTTEDIVGGCLDDIVSEIDSLRDEAQSSLDNMPEHLQETSSSGELLRERIDGLELWGEELQSVNIPDELTDEEEKDEEMVENYESEIEQALEEIQGADCGL